MVLDFFWDLQQHQAIQGLTKDSRETGRAARRAARETEDMQVAIERLSLACRAMWELLSERAGVSEEQLLEKVREIDLRDGQLDGKSKAPPKTCAGCSRANNARRTRCVYCDAPLAPRSAFDGV